MQMSRFFGVLSGALLLTMLGIFAPREAAAEDLYAAVVPNARTVPFGTAATAFASAINVTNRTLTNCGPKIPGAIPGAFAFRPTNPSTNLPSGPVGQKVSVAPGGVASFVFSLTATQVFTARTFPVVVECSNAATSRITPGVNTFALGVSDFSPPDIVPIVQTLSHDNVVRLASPGATTVFVAAAINIGSERNLIVRPNIEGTTLPVFLGICESDASGACLAPYALSVPVEFPPDVVKTFTVRVSSYSGSAPIPFDPAINRISLDFLEGSVLRATSSVAVTTNGATPPPADPDAEGPGSAAMLVLDNLNPSGFADAGSPVEFAVVAGALDTTPGATSAWHNGNLLAASDIVVTANRIVISHVLHEGLNHIRVQTRDTRHDLIDSEQVIWAGSHTLEATILDAADDPVPNARVQFRVNQDEEVFVQLLSDAQGRAIAHHLPDHPINIYAYSPNLEDSASLSVQGNAGSATLTLRPLDPPSDVDNNNFQMGSADGWITSPGATIIAHQEDGTSSGSPSNGDYDLQVSTDYSQEKMYARRTIEVAAPQGQGSQGQNSGAEVAFNLRHRFITTEVPGGYCGTRFNDAFGIEARVVLPGGSSLEPTRRVSSMNQLGCSAFNQSSGATGWMDFQVMAPAGSTLEVEAFVQNVGDSAYQSYLELDGLDEPPLVISDVLLKDLLNENLKFLSVSPVLPANVDRIKVNGRLAIRREAQNSSATASRIVLRVRQGGLEVEGQLSSQARSYFIGKPLPASGVLEWNSNAVHLFEIPHAALAGWDTSNNAEVSLTVELTPSEGRNSARANNPETVSVVTRQNLSLGRYSTDRNVTLGGDDWGKNSTIEFLAGLTEQGPSNVTFNDASKMHAGRFPPHTGQGHANGVAVDMKLPGFPFEHNAHQKTGANADELIAFYNAHSNMIRLILTSLPNTTNSNNDCALASIDKESDFYKKLLAEGLVNASNTGKVRCHGKHGHMHVELNLPGPGVDNGAHLERLVAARRNGILLTHQRP